MNSKARVMAAINHRGADRTPITFDAEKEVFAALSRHPGTPTREALFDRLNVDTWMILPGNFIYTAEEARKSEKTAPWGYRRLIDCLGRDGGYIFGPGHTYIQIDAPLANIMAMYSTAAAYRPWS